MNQSLLTSVAGIAIGARLPVKHGQPVLDAP